MNRWLLGIILLAFGIGAFKASGFRESRMLAPPVPQPYTAHPSGLQSSFASSMQHVQTHAASVIELKDGRIRAFWFSGSREGAKDVEIHSAVFDPANRRWGMEQAVATREGTQRTVMRYISKLGNPVAGRAADGSLWLYFVTVSMGGWAGSSITAMNSVDEGVSWGPARRLISTPFLNISTLVKGAPFLFDDGTMGLPAYHEFITKFGEILHLDKNGSVINKQRLSGGGEGALQPVVVQQSSNDAIALMRYAGAAAPHRVLMVSTHDGGQHWSSPIKTVLSNPDAALTALALQDGRLLAVLNNQEQGRDALVLMISLDGGSSWKNVYTLEDQRNSQTDKQLRCAGQNCCFEFSYPYLIRAHTGDFHLVYTWNRTFIKHLWFTQDWLEQRLQESTAANQPAHD